MYKAALLRPLSLLWAAERKLFPNPLIFLYPSRCPSPCETPTSPFPHSIYLVRSFSSFTAKERVPLPPYGLPFPLHSVLFSSTPQTPREQDVERPDESEDEEWVIEWEEEDSADPLIGDGGDGGGIVLGDAKWGERALSVAREVLNLHFSEDLVLFAFKVSPRGYVYVRLDKLTNKYGCPNIEEIKKFNSLYKTRLDEIIESGEIPLDLAIEVSSPGAERLLKVPEDLDRFRDMPLRANYLEQAIEPKRHQEKDGVFLIDSFDIESGSCVWKLADVRENRGEAGKGRGLSRRQKDWRLELPFGAIKMLTLYLS
ncbi:uncharacterized protein LOC122052459 [Zingiber officinale]|uniref:uncharacterized protein LOC122052459 n=1 Tax=Zingiber officinale TaxID=94328 RepID=UPI001C4AD09B|nr:uncharacterized protein LOC122052459 [Zingiber officinale]